MTEEEARQEKGMFMYLLKLVGIFVVLTILGLVF